MTRDVVKFPESRVDSESSSSIENPYLKPMIINSTLAPKLNLEPNYNFC